VYELQRCPTETYVQIVFQASKPFTVGGMNDHSRVLTDSHAIIWNQHVNGARNQADRHAII